MQVRTLAIVSLAATLWAVSPVALAQADAGHGTWKLNVAKSKFKPGPPAKEGTVKFEAAGKGVKGSTDWVTGAGDKLANTYTAQYDGKDYPIKGSATADTVALKMADAKTVERVDKKGGKVVNTFVRKLSADGKTMTVTQKGTTAKGEAIDHVLVFDRVN